MCHLRTAMRLTGPTERCVESLVEQPSDSVKGAAASLSGAERTLLCVVGTDGQVW